MKKTLIAAAAEAEKRGWASSKSVNAEKEKTLAYNGIKVANPSDDLKVALKTVGASMSADWLKATGETGKAIFATYEK